MTSYDSLKAELQAKPVTWLVTGAAGFIGSHLAGALLALGQNVKGLDDFSSGRRENFQSFEEHSRFTFIEGDIQQEEVCRAACENVDYVLHHAAIGSVARSLEAPALVDRVNNGGFLNILTAARERGIKRVVYASSSAVYGDGQSNAARRENDPLQPLSPYAVTKCANELNAAAMAQAGELAVAGLRYFNIYGPRQDPEGAYAAVIPKWIGQMLAGEVIEIYGDGETVRDFCYIEDVVQANIRAALAAQGEPHPVYNIAAGAGTTLNELFIALKKLTEYQEEPVYKDFRKADIRLSQADISMARGELGYEPSFRLEEGLALTVDWFKERHP